jgi:hypothetical protein
MRKAIVFSVFLPVLSWGQVEGKVWSETGIKGSFSKKIDWAAELTCRFGSYGLETYFPQATIRYKVNKYLRPSIDYRLIFDKDEFTNYLSSQRLNFNIDAKYPVKRFELGVRCRYQYSFNRLNNPNYDVEFDQAWRFKGQLAYDIKGLPLSPVTSIEYFYNPEFGPTGKRFVRYRFYAGVNFDLDAPHDISIGYLLDQQFNVSNPRSRHILSLGYTYLLGKEKKTKKKAKTTRSTIRTL